MKLQILTTVLAAFLPFAALAQQHYLVTFKDKGPEAAAFLQHPERILSQKALERRQQAGVEITLADAPVSRQYLQQLQTSGAGILQKSKWLNTVLVSSGKTEAELRKSCPAISTIKEYKKVSNKNTVKTGNNTHALTQEQLNYGAATDQIMQLNLDCLHDRGYTGAGVLVAQFDSGWDGVDSLAAYNQMRAENRFIATRNFVDPSQTVYTTHNHGTITFSVMAANLPGQFVGGAPQASYALALTEDVSQEVHQEELNWAAAAEWADSLGADIITSSLGYKNFDPGQVDYTSADLNGDFAIITRAADYAASRGILVVTSAGNSGWQGISAPCDGDSVLCVGAVDINNQIASFSSIGPTGDGRVKPDVVALGVSTASILPDGGIAGVNGTSLSCPMMAGLVTCLKQAHPTASNMQIIEAVKQSADRRNNPGIMYGWGLPDACRADSLLSIITGSAPALPSSPNFGLKTNIADRYLTLLRHNQQTAPESIEIYAITGQRMQRVQNWGMDAGKMEIDIHNLSSGLYILSVQPQNGAPQVFKFVKQ